LEEGLLSSGIEKLVEDIIKESTAKAQEVRKQGLAGVEESIQGAKDEATREADQIARGTRTEASAVRNRLVSREKQRARLAYLAEKNRIVNEVLDDVRARFRDFTQDKSSYRSYLVKTIARGLEGIPSENVRVALSKRDMERFKEARLLEDALAIARIKKELRFDGQPITTAGGAMLMSEDGKIRTDCTFEAKLRLLQPQLLAEISKTLFA